MAPRRSSADPAALSQFAAATLDALATLRVRSDAVTRSLDTLASAGSDVAVPGTGDVPAELADLVTDWEHLGTFARDVANGFYWLLGEVGYHGGVVTFADSSLTRLGIVGYADRDEAIAAAEAMAERFRDLRAEGYDGLSPDAVHDLLAMAERGQHDPAFAVAFSESIGVEGYVDLTAMVRHAYQPGGIYEPVPQAGLDGVEVLATTLSTALATLPGLPPGEGSAATAGWSRGERLDPSFVDELAGGFDVEEGRYNTDFPVRTNTDLSVLLSFTAAPTSVAVTIANGRLTPLLRDPERFDARPGDEGDDWGDHGGRITNYATMLGRDPDASARWLADEVRGTQNLDLVLQRGPDRDIPADGGRALAEVVEHGVTHHDDALRSGLMERSIEVIGGDQDAIHNPHLPDALARGVAHNMPVIHGLIDREWLAGDEAGLPTSVRNTHDFLVEVMRDGSAANTVVGAVEEFSFDAFRDLPEPLVDDAGDADRRFERTEVLEGVGAVQGLVLTAERTVIRDSLEDYLAQQEMQGDLLNFGVGVFPFGGTAQEVIGPINDILDAQGVSLGELTAANPAEEYNEADDVVAIRRVNNDIGNLVLLTQAGGEGPATPLGDLTTEELEELVRRIDASSQAHDDQNHLVGGIERVSDRLVADL